MVSYHLHHLVKYSLCIFLICDFLHYAEGDAIVKSDVRAVNIPCMCEFPTCSCCASIAVGTAPKAELGCAEVTFDQKDVGVHFRLQIANRTLYDNQVSVVNPSAACIPVPMVPFLAFCAQLYDLHLNESEGNACLKLSVQLFDSDAVTLDLQCLHLENGVLTAQPTG